MSIFLFALVPLLGISTAGFTYYYYPSSAESPKLPATLLEEIKKGVKLRPVLPRRNPKWDLVMKEIKKKPLLRTVENELGRNQRQNTKSPSDMDMLDIFALRLKNIRKHTKRD